MIKNNRNIINNRKDNRKDKNYKINNKNNILDNKIITLKDIDIKDINKTYKYENIEYLRLIKCKDTKKIINNLINLKYLELIECENIKETKNNKNLETLIKINCINDLINKDYNEYYLIHPELTKIKSFKYKCLYNKSSIQKYKEFLYDKQIKLNKKYNYQNYIIPNTLINLNYINLQNMPNKLIHIPNTLINLSFINLIDCKFNDIPKTLINLKTINITNNMIKNMKDNYNKIYDYNDNNFNIKLYNTFINLQNIYLYNCIINNNKILFKTFTNLKKLYLLRNKLEFKINFNIIKYYLKLEEIVLDGNDDINFEKNEYYLKIILNSNNLIKIELLINYCFNIIFPKKLNKLNYLSLFNSSFSYLPYCYNLKSLYLINIDNKLINKIFHYINPNNLNSLKIKDCFIINLPNNLINLNFLQLYRCNNIKLLPNNLNNLNNLQLFFCNYIKNIPDNLFNLKTLKLDMCNNIKNIPNFNNLISINISNCKFIKNIKDIKDLKNKK